MESLLLKEQVQSVFEGIEWPWSYTVHCVEELENAAFLQCLQILDDNLGEVYTIVQGREWKTKKMVEMKENGLIYILLDQLGFLSLKVIGEYSLRTVYLYEIQLGESQRGNGQGTKLLNAIYQVACNLSTSAPLRQEWLANNMEIGDDDVSELENGDPVVTSTALTVFSSNLNARRLYEKLGYRLMEGSPKARVLRGRVVEPDYYILERKVGVRYGDNATGC